MKNLQSIQITYNMLNLDANSIKQAVAFIHSAQKCAKSILSTTIHIAYTRALYTFPNIMEFIANTMQPITASISDFTISFRHEFGRESVAKLCPLFQSLHTVTNFAFIAHTTLNLKTPEDLHSFIGSFRTIMKTVKTFNFDISEAATQTGYISSITEIFDCISFKLPFLIFITSFKLSYVC